jgi:hypothetical protein
MFGLTTCGAAILRPKEANAMITPRSGSSRS